MRSSLFTRDTATRDTATSGSAIRGISVATTAVVVSAALLTAGATAAAAATPPYEPTGQAVGTITFYDRTGNVITSGSTQVAFAGYAVGSSAPRSTDQQAGLVFANPNPSTSAYKWYSHLTGSFSSYPVTTAPTSITTQTTPVYTVADSDQTIDQFEATATQYSGTGYTDTVQVRLYTADANGQVTKTYDDADLVIDPATHTWTEVYPTGGTTPPPSADSTKLSIKGPSAVRYGTSATITGTLTDTTTSHGLAGQTVKLYARPSSKSAATLVKTVTSGANGALSASVKLTGARGFQWRFPARSAYLGSTSAYTAVSVTTSVSIAVDHRTIKHGKVAVFYGSTTPATSGIHVHLQQLVGTKWKNVGTGVQKRQKLPNHKTAVAYRIPHKIAHKGTDKFRVVKAATSALRGSVSRTITEHVK